MNVSLILGSLWVLAATVTAFLPMRWQYPPGIALLIWAPVLIGWIGYDFGWFVAFLALAASLSMFRNPLRYFYARARGEKPELPR